MTAIQMQDGTEHLVEESVQDVVEAIERTKHMNSSLYDGFLMVHFTTVDGALFFTDGEGVDAVAALLWDTSVDFLEDE